MNRIYRGDCIEKMKELDENSIDAIVTDPPYGLAFMGKSWDTFDAKGYQEFSNRWATEALRVLKPGGHLLAFSGTRTYHRMAVGIEDAGFEVRDCIAWVYGNGFPKSHNIGVAVDKLQGNEREVVGGRLGTDFSDAQFVQQGSMMQRHHKAPRTVVKVTRGNSPWEGWGTALKPSLEPIVVARKPFKGSVAENVLRWGTGGINVDGCRIGTKGGTAKDNPPKDKSNGIYGDGINGNCDIISLDADRFPANLIHDGSDEVVGLFPETTSGGGVKANKGTVGLYGIASNVTTEFEPNTGSAARFFYCAKAHKKERDAGLDDLNKVVAGGMKDRQDGSFDGNVSMGRNHHPTVKPIDLMRYLIRLVTPPNGIVLDPFAGSGSTGCAAVMEGKQYILMEMDPEFADIIIPKRVAWWKENGWKMTDDPVERPGIKKLTDWFIG